MAICLTPFRNQEGRPCGGPALAADTASGPEPGPVRAASGLREGLDILVDGRTGHALGVPRAGPAARAAFRLARGRARWLAGGAASAPSSPRRRQACRQRAPSPKDRRFADPAWQHSWPFRRIAQAYLAAVATTGELIGDAELDWAADGRAAVRGREYRRTRGAERTSSAVEPGRAEGDDRRRGRQPGERSAEPAAGRLTPPRLPASVDTSSSRWARTWRRRPGLVVHRARFSS